MFPHSISDNIAFGVKRVGRPARAELIQIVEQALRRPALWDEVKDRLKNPASPDLGRQAAAPAPALGAMFDSPGCQTVADYLQIDRQSTDGSSGADGARAAACC